MASKRNVTVETPGEARSDSGAGSVEAAPVEAKTSPAAVTSQLTASQEVTLKQDLIKTAKLVGASEVLDWSHLNQGAILEAQRFDPDANLPHVDTVDAATIKAPVLTKSGWVLPLNDPRNRIGQR